MLTTTNDGQPAPADASETPLRAPPGTASTGPPWAISPASWPPATRTGERDRPPTTIRVTAALEHVQMLVGNPADLRVVVNGYEDGYGDLSPGQVSRIRVALNTGKHE